jgi:hypothetical protein
MAGTPVPSYPVFIPSKGRPQGTTARLFDDAHVDYRLVVEPQERDEYEHEHPDRVIELPESGKGVTWARNWILDAAQREGVAACWMFDDNIWRFFEFGDVQLRRRRQCDPEEAFSYAEALFDRYLNAGMLGFNYSMFGNGARFEWVVNRWCYSAFLMRVPPVRKFRLRYNEDVDLCLQLLDTGYWCTIQVQRYMVWKKWTRASEKGGNHDTIYAGDGRLLKPLVLARVWPQYVKVVHRFGGPHHFVNWGQFKHGLIRREAVPDV